MKKIILIIEDQIDEQEIAKVEVLNIGLLPVVANNLNDGLRLLEKMKSKILAVVTDLHFPSMKDNNTDADKPNGFGIISWCVENNKPVAVCSNVNGHFASYIKYPINTFETHQFYTHKKIPLSLGKNWKESINKVINI